MILLVIISFLCGIMGASLIYHKGIQAGFSDNPNNRSSHTIPTPKGGGIGILIAFLIASLWFKLDIYFLLPVFIVSFSGFVDDRIELSSLFRLGIHFFAACMLVFGADSCYIPWWFLLFWSLFITGTANCCNFMDGINGIAALSAITAFFLVVYYLHLTGISDDHLRICLCVASACLGFLPFNLLKGRVFMGDTGSLLLGFLFGAVVFRFSRNLHEFFILASFLFPFYCDELTTMVIRIKRGENLLKAHRKHMYQILVNEAGFSHFSVAALYFLLQVFVGVTVILLHKMESVWIFSLLVLYFTLFSIGSTVIRQKYYETN